MNSEVSIFWLQEAAKLALTVGAPLLGVALVLGIVVSLFQAITSIQEMSLSFGLKLIGVTVVLLVLAPWMLQMLVDFTTRLFTFLPNVSH